MDDDCQASEGNWGDTWTSALVRSLGLERYEAAFRDNEITENVLPKLTAEDPKELGVNALGHRRTLLEAVELLRSGTKTQPIP